MADNVYRSIDISVPANGRYELNRLARFIKVLSSNLTEFNISIDNDSEGIAFQGFGIEVPEEFLKLDIINNNASQLDITLGLSDNLISDDRVNLSGTVAVSIAGSATPSNPASNVTTSAGNLLLAANSSRKYFEIYNNSALDLIYTGTDNTGTGGVTIKANGGYYTAEMAGAVYGAAIGGTITNTDIEIIEAV